MAMGNIAHILPAALLAALISTGDAPAGSAADTPDDPLRFFATCAGRLNSELSYQWTLSDPAADRTEALLDATADIVAALTTEDRAVQARAWSIEARAAHGALLSRAVFQGDAWAADRAATLVTGCVAYILGPDADPCGISLADRLIPASIAAD
ncbi:hypothetical protein HKCCE3408_16785 [Rhodobacterales bacterium HKCCE3408]|nr:hypothetical protein [Rhodobacterales bacterium HKCCE3408]